MSDDELAKLQARIVKDRAVAELFAQATRMDAALTSMMRDDAAIRDLTLSMQQIEDGATPQPASTMSRDRRYTSTIVAWSTISAAVLILAGGFALWWSGKSPSSEPAEVAGAPHSVISGQRGDKGEKSTSFKVDKDTAVVVDTDQDEEVKVKREGGERTIKRPKQAEAKLAELTQRQRVSVTHLDGKAIKIVGLRPRVRTREGDGERSRENPAPKRIREGEREREKKDREGDKTEARKGERERKREVKKEESQASVSAPAARPAAPGLKLPNAGLVKSKASGAWSSPDTWDGGKRPGSGNQVLIREGDRVVYDVASDDVIRSLHISGTLTFAHDKDTLLNAGLIRIQPGDKVIEEGFDCDHVPDAKKLAAAAKDASQPGFSAICVCCQSKSALLVGTPEQPIDGNHKAVIRLHYVDGMNAESCPAIVACGGRMDFHGAPLNRTWVKLGADTALADSEIVLAEPVTGWRVGDTVIVTSSGRLLRAIGTEEARIKSIEGTRIVLDSSLTQPHPGEGDYRCEVANLSRNVVVESATPEGVRGHTMYHLGSAGSISYAEFRHLGKEGVLGRYNLHYHLCGDSMRGASVVGCSFHHSQNRWLTIHGTNYLIVRDNVGYQSIGHGFFLEDGTEVYSVFDRNLAVQALAGRPLPKQILPFDANSGAGFWFANAHNTFTNNVATECRHYGFRFEATPKAGVIHSDGAPIRDIKFGDPKAPFDLALNVRQPDGSRKHVDVRTLSFVRFENNETHGNGHWGLNIGEGVGGVGPDAMSPFVLRNTKIWNVVGGFGVQSPHVLLDGLTIHEATYGVRASQYVGQDYRNVSIDSRGATIATLEQYLASNNNAGSRRHRQPGWPEGTGDGGPRFQPAEIEVARLTPVDKLPPMTVITSTRRDGSQLIVRGTTSDASEIKAVTVNGEPARAVGDNFSQWEATLTGIDAGIVEISAGAVDTAGNKEQTPHEMTIVVQ